MSQPRKRALRKKRIRLQEVLQNAAASSSSSEWSPPEVRERTPPMPCTQPADRESGATSPPTYFLSGREQRQSRSWVPKHVRHRGAGDDHVSAAPREAHVEVADAVPAVGGGESHGDDEVQSPPLEEGETPSPRQEEESATLNWEFDELDDEHLLLVGDYDARLDIHPERDVRLHESDESEHEEDTTNWTVKDATRHLYGVKIRHNVSDRAFEATWKAFREILPVLQGVPPEALPSARTIKRQALRDLPEFRLEVAHINRETGEEVYERDLEKFPHKKYEERSVWKPMYQVWRAKVEDVLLFHRSQHTVEGLDEVILNVDGVPIGRTGRSQIIVSIKFADCRSVYQLVNAIPFNEGKKLLTVTFLLGDVLHELARLSLRLNFITADAPMRAFLRNQKSHSGRMACDYCYGIAKHEGKPIWGLKTINQEARTMRRLLQDYEEHDVEGRPLAEYGYRGKCELMELLPGWDFINGIPVDPMHLLFLGIARCLFELLFQVGEARVVNDRSVRREKTEGLDEDLVRQRVPHEVPRRPRPVDFKNWKAAEWRSLTLHLFPLVVARLPKGLRRQMWLEFSYLSRAYTLEDEDFEKLDRAALDALAIKWYRNYHHLFGYNNMRYNIHLFLHLGRIRVHGPFSKISAFPFEGSFAASGRAQKPGTLSEGLQSMRASYLRPQEGHTCEKTLLFRSDTTARTDDTLIYTKNHIYKIRQVPLEAGAPMLAEKVITTTYFPPVRTKLDFQAVGLSKFLCIGDHREYIYANDVKGKVIAVSTSEDTILVKVSRAELVEAD